MSDNNTQQRGLHQRRRAVYTALSKVLQNDERRAFQMFALWEHNYANQPHFLVTRYVGDGVHVANLSDSERLALSRAIFVALSQPYDQLQPYPEAWLDAPAPAIERRAPSAPGVPATRTEPAPAPAAVNGAATPMDAPAAVMGHVARLMLKPIGEATRSKTGLLAEIIADAVAHAKLRQGLSQRASVWLQAGAVDDSLGRGLDVADLRAIVHAVYLCACDALGPVAADQLLAQSIMRTQMIPAAGEFAPDQLLS